METLKGCLAFWGCVTLGLLVVAAIDVPLFYLLNWVTSYTIGNTLVNGLYVVWLVLVGVCIVRSLSLSTRLGRRLRACVLALLRSLLGIDASLTLEQAWEIARRHCHIANRPGFEPVGVDEFLRCFRVSTRNEQYKGPLPRLKMHISAKTGLVWFCDSGVRSSL